MFDLVIRGGTIVDGAGAAPFTGDIAITDGAIVEIGVLTGAAAKNVLDADGALVTPGWVDAHTHYDGQVSWDDTLESSIANGTTSVVMGNCGVGFAPVAVDATDTLIDFMEGVEDIPGTALYEGVPWGQWESFPSYLDYLDTRRFSVDVAAQVPHAPLRLYVMGERALHDGDSTPDDVTKMAQIVTESIKAGAAGFSTSRITFHRTASGQTLPGTYAPEQELLALAKAMVDGGGGVFQAVPASSAGNSMYSPKPEQASMLEEVAMFGRLSRATGVPFNFILAQIRDNPNGWREVLAASAQENSTGAKLFPMIGSRGISGITTLRTYHAFSRRPTFVALQQKLSHSELVAAMRGPEVKAAILAEADAPTDKPGSMDNVQPAVFAAALERTFPFYAGFNYEPPVSDSFLARAQSVGRDPLEFMYDFLLEEDGNALGVRFSGNYWDGSLDACREMMLDANTVWGLSDAGAHVKYVCDMSTPTFNLVHWVRDRSHDRLPVEFIVQKMTSRNAHLYGLNDRGILQVGKRADVNVIDLDNLAVHKPVLCFDLPAGGERFHQAATGYLATVVNGELVRQHDTDTGARPGRLARTVHN